MLVGEKSTRTVYEKYHQWVFFFLMTGYVTYKISMCIKWSRRNLVIHISIYIVDFWYSVCTHVLTSHHHNHYLIHPQRQIGTKDKKLIIHCVLVPISTTSNTGTFLKAECVRVCMLVCSIKYTKIPWFHITNILGKYTNTPICQSTCPATGALRTSESCVSSEICAC